MSKPLKEKRCKGCGTIFLQEAPKQDYCELSCRDKAHKERWSKRYWRNKSVFEEKNRKYQLAQNKERAVYWRCPECDKKIKLDFRPLRSYQKLKEIKCSCGFVNV